MTEKKNGDAAKPAPLRQGPPSSTDISLVPEFSEFLSLRKSRTLGKT